MHRSVYFTYIIAPCTPCLQPDEPDEDEEEEEPFVEELVPQLVVRFMPMPITSAPS